jgi:hypothetical protein
MGVQEKMRWKSILLHLPDVSVSVDIRWQALEKATIKLLVP